MNQPPDSPALHLLAVEDDPVLRHSAARAGRRRGPGRRPRHGHHARRRDGRLRRRGADCVLLDLSLPDAVGLEGLETLAKAFPALPIVVLTNTDQESTALAAVAQGAEDFLAKRGADGATILRAVRYARGGRRRRRTCAEPERSWPRPRSWRSSAAGSGT